MRSASSVYYKQYSALNNVFIRIVEVVKIFLPYLLISSHIKVELHEATYAIIMFFVSLPHKLPWFVLDCIRRTQDLYLQIIMLIKQFPRMMQELNYKPFD